ncbi:MAG: tRNA threonylcarbamoyladenosine dehydratase [Atopobiaceae bacterium]|nr:tRNA threonylcarbamoyladenosine dehydratase [Atopobiaceae bacterium]
MEVTQRNNELFSRTELLLGKAAMERLAQARVIVFGLGGVGGAATEALARAGVGHIAIVDDDVVGLSNMNRQIVATTQTVGMPKVDAMAQRIASISPSCEVEPHRCFYLPATSDQIDISSYDYAIDAVDTVTAKLHIISRAREVGTPVISCMGTANKMDPTALRVDDIQHTSVCPLARIMRKEARKRGLGHFLVVYSTEPARTPVGEVDLKKELRKGSSNRSVPGSVSFVPPVAGYILASVVVRSLSKCG